MDYPYPYLTVCLLDGCNRVCRHCYRTAIPSDHGFKLKKKDALLSLDDASSLKTACLFAGGEPTIWQDDDMDLLSLLIRSAKRHGRVAFISNGHVFEDKNYASRFIQRYLKECGLPLRMMFTVDFIHENYDPKTERIPFLDNLLAERICYDACERIALTFISHWTKDERLNIPLHVFDHYADQGVHFKINDFMMWGRGVELEDLACYLEVGSTDKEGLGSYREILLTDMISSGKIGDESKFEKLPNKELLSKISVCGRSPNFYISWGNKYFYCIPQMGHDWFSISEIGQLNLDDMKSFFAERPIIKEIQEKSIFGVLDQYNCFLEETILEKIKSMRESVRFAGCSVCLELYQKGILQEINQRILNKS